MGSTLLPGGSRVRATWKSLGLCCAPCRPQHRSKGRKLHNFLMFVPCSSLLFPQTHPSQFLVPVRGLGSVVLAWPSCRGLAWLSAVPPLHPWAVIAPQQGTADRGLRRSTLEL